MRALPIAAAFVLVLVAGPPPARAGQCGGTCSTVCRTGGCDFDSLAACVLGVADGETCRVLGGIYHEFVTYQPGFLRQDLVLQCADPVNAPCVIDGDNVRASAVESYRNWTLEGFEIRNTTGDAITSYAANYAVGSVRDCWIHDVGGRGIGHLGAGNVAEGNRIERTGATGIWCGTAAGGAVIRNNLVVSAGVTSSGRGIECSLAGSEVLHNTVDQRDSSAPWAGASAYGILATTAKYNVVLGGNVGIQASVASEQNLAWAWVTSAFGGAGTQAGNVTGDPVFLSVEDWRLGTGSPAIGLATTSTLATDLLGRARVAPDAGAYERVDGDTAALLRWPVREEVRTTTSFAAPAMTLLPGRGPMVAWFDVRSASAGDLLVSERLPDGTWRATVVSAGSVVPSGLSTNSFLQSVDLAVDPLTGRPAIAWVDRSPTGLARLRVARFLGEECATGDCTDPRWDGCGDPPLATGAGDMSVAIAFRGDGAFPAVAAAWEETSGCGAGVARYQVLYARPDAQGTWQASVVETAACGGRVGYGIDLAFDPLTGAPALAWARSTTAYGALVFASDTGAGFVPLEVSIGSGTGTAYEKYNRVSLAYAADGALGIAFTLHAAAAPERNGFGFVQRGPGGWQSEAVVVDAQLGPNSLRPYQGLDLAWDPSGTPWFVHALLGVVSLADRDTEGWDFQGLDVRRVAGHWARLAFDATGRKSLSYQHETSAKVIRFWSEADPGGLVLPRPTACDDGDPCTASACDPVRGCQHAPVDCDDTNPCTTDGCDRATGCTHAPVVCDDGEPCTRDLCDAASGQCLKLPVDCDDGNACTTDPCREGVGCEHGTVICTDGDACTADGCDPATGCTHVAVNCSDGDRCTLDGCDPATGCAHDPVICDDGDRCSADRCDGVRGCVTDPLDCADPDPCTVDLCNPASGCVHLPDGCDDGDACTTDACDPVLGCVHDRPSCDDGEPCTRDFCDRLTGSCQHPPTDCADGDACTSDSCRDGVGCVHGARDCNDQDACTADGCDPATGCTHVAVNCSDGDRCTLDGCDPATGCAHDPVVCDDGDRCSEDRCDGVAGCVFLALDCTDRDACTLDLCDPALGCVHPPAGCDDGNACTTDGCDPALGCQHAAVDCDDADACTTDGCDRAKGCTHDPVDCTDGDACTTDQCSAATGCRNVAVDCDDGDACNVDTCDPATGCKHRRLECDDGDFCTIDDCDPAVGCTHVPNPCDDGEPCTDDLCTDRGCAHSPTVCDDNDQCTTDVCIPGSGCAADPWTGPCEDGDPATIQDTCILGICKGIPNRVELPLVLERIGVADTAAAAPPVVVTVAERIGVAEQPIVTPPATITVTERIGLAVTGTGSATEGPPEPVPDAAEPVPDTPEPAPDAAGLLDDGSQFLDATGRDSASDPGIPPDAGYRDTSFDAGGTADAGGDGGGGGGLCSAGGPGSGAPALLLLAMLAGVRWGLRRPRR